MGGPFGEKMLGVASTMQNREAMQDQRKREYELRIDALDQKAERDRQASEDKNRSIDERARAAQMHQETMRMIAQMHDSARREGLALRRELAGDKSAEKKEKEAEKVAQKNAPVSDLVNEIDKAIRMVEENPGVSGARGMFTRGKEFVQSTVSPGTPTPGSDFQSQIIDIQSRWKKLPTVAANRFKADATKIDSEIKGLGTFTSDTMAINSLKRLRDSLASGLESRGVEVPAGDATRGKINVPKISNDEEFAALPSGTEFIGPDGKRRRKP